MKLSSFSAAILFGACLVGGPRATADTISSTESFLPAVHVIGATGVYRTDITIFNPDPALAAAIDISYGEADRDGHVLRHRALDVRPRRELWPSRSQELVWNAGPRHEQHV